MSLTPAEITAFLSAPFARDSALERRELVVRLRGKGHTYAQIALELEVSIHTVRSDVSIMRKRLSEQKREDT